MLMSAWPTCTAASDTPDEARIVRPLDSGWRLQYGEVADAASPSLDDAAWAAVSLPHCLRQAGPAWYRLRLKMPAHAAGKAVYAEFGAVSPECEVFWDGRPAGGHRGSYAAFRLLLTARAAAGADHLLAVRVDPGLKAAIPNGGSWGLCSGIYRPARLVLTGPISLDLLDCGGPGVYVSTERLDGAAARIRATIRLRNVAADPRKATVAVRVLDADHRTAAEGALDLDVPGGAAVEGVLPMRIDRPRPWSGRVDPHLYTASVDVRCDDTLTDRAREPFGVRTAGIDPERGFLLNGRPLDLRGVGLHQEVGPHNWAAKPQDIDRDFALIAEMGCTGVRLVHYPHSLYTHRLCDRLGLVAWSGLAVYNHISAGESYAAGARQQLIEMARQTYNCPSVCIWGLSNEVRLGKGPDPSPLLEELVRIAKREDPCRIVTVAGKGGDPVEKGLDAMGITSYFGWYSGMPEDFGPEIDRLRGRFRPTPIGIAEYGAGCNPAIHALAPQKRDHSEEWQCLVHEAHWRAMRERPWLWCKFIWLGFDFTFPGLKEPGMPGINNKGLVTRDRQIKKDAFYWYKAQWSDEPFVHVTSRRFTPREAEKTPVKVYSNCPEVELIVGGASRGVRRPEDRVAVWPDVTLRPGENAVEAVGRKDGEAFRDRCVWTLRTPNATRSGDGAGRGER
jgi:beta-galactosidase